MRTVRLRPWGLELLRPGVLIFLPLLLVVALVMLLLYRVQVNAARSVLYASEKQVLDLAAHSIATRFDGVHSDLLYLAESSVVQRWLASDESARRRQIEQEFITFAAHKGIYDQIRILDLGGREVVRVHGQAGHPITVPRRALQNKSDRHYVRASLALARSEIHVSPFELNVEHGAIEQPLKPVIRFGTPVYNNQGHQRGILVLNYRGQGLIDQVKAIAAQAGGQLWLLDARGYWLLGPDAQSEWAFMYPDRGNRRFDVAHSSAWTSILQGPMQAQFLSGDGLYTYAKLAPRALPPVSSAATVPDWILVAYMGTPMLAAKTRDIRRNLGIAFSVLLLLVAMISWAIAYQNLSRRRAETSMRSSEARFRAVAETANDAVITADSHGDIVYFNRAAERIFGYTSDAAVMQPLAILMPERFRRDHKEGLQRFLVTGEARVVGKTVELVGQRKDGVEFPMELSLATWKIGNQVYFTGLIRDITQRRQAEGHIRQLNEDMRVHAVELEAVNRELEAFSYSVSHDLRAPLRAIDGFSQVLLEDYAAKLDVEGRGYLERVRAAAQRMGLLIDDLIKLSRVTRAELLMQAVDLSEIAAGIASELRAREPRRQVELTIEAGLSAHGDARLLRIALENLFSNAWKFTQGRDPAHIVFGRTQHNGLPAYFVQDDGVGFDATYADKLFGVFQRLHDAREFPGTGIGLATVQRVIHKHGGHIWAHSTSGKGATFYFML